MSSPNVLARRLGTGDAVTIGLGSMIGAGIFAAFAPAAAAAGTGLVIGLGIAAVVAYCNATSSAQLAAQYPTSGGTYVYGRERLGDWPGFLAGWGFIIGKTASCAAMAMTFAAYALPGPWQKPLAIAAVLALATINYFGVTRTAAATRVIVTIVLAILAVVVIAGLSSGAPAVDDGQSLTVTGGWYGVLQSAGLLFFAFAGYARIATMGEEVKNPERTIPRAILTALGLAVTIYALIAVSLLLTVGAQTIASSDAPLVEVVTVRGWDWAGPLVRIGAAAAALGALLALIAGVGRTSLAMARNRDLPGWLSAVHPRYQVPHRAEITLAAVVSVIIALVDLRGAIGFSSFGVLLYYFVTNISAYTQNPSQRLYPKVWQVLGAIGCLILVATLPPVSIAAGAGMFLIGIIYRAVRLRVSRS
ncbi:APC family permease [Brachybacterium alimentarium]|uniref:APC family permease n=1 Tax=Brachybacterium alimentarium TaxID=47845 RepID=UPI003FD6ADF5